MSISKAIDYLSRISPIKSERAFHLKDCGAHAFELSRLRYQPYSGPFELEIKKNMLHSILKEAAIPNIERKKTDPLERIYINTLAPILGKKRLEAIFENEGLQKSLDTDESIYTCFNRNAWGLEDASFCVIRNAAKSPALYFEHPFSVYYYLKNGAFEIKDAKLIHFTDATKIEKISSDLLMWVKTIHLSDIQNERFKEEFYKKKLTLELRDHFFFHKASLL